jgi:hypothetical protein
VLPALIALLMTHVAEVTVAGLGLPAMLPGSAEPRVDEALNPRRQQVRIEQRVIIRIAPLGAGQPLDAEPRWRRGDPPPPPVRERRIGRCLPLAGIAGAGLDRSDRLLLLMRDRRLIGADLEPACSARDFYSGFYIEPSRDGLLCVGRDMLRARSGTNCSLSGLRQLAPPGR